MTATGKKRALVIFRAFFVLTLILTAACNSNPISALPDLTLPVLALAIEELLGGPLAQTASVSKTQNDRSDKK
jgi:hypothetical protein